jgi:aspartyl-tRNA(Asn)/glutamyl-tRNA(Gln) amidotransferase subunit A
MSILEFSKKLRAGSLSPVELTRECLARIEEFNPVLNAFITVTADLALRQAQEAENEIRAGRWRGPLHGIPIGLKDLIDVAGVRTTAASRVFENRLAQADAEVVRRLREAGAIILGKQNLHEFAYGGSSVISANGPVHNPWNVEQITGGSSGGSAASVAAGLGYAAIGTDTAGSIREPAALCGIVGLKPTYGLVSAQGVIPLSQSLDHVGPLTTTVADAALMLDAITDKPDPRASFATALQEGPQSLRVGLPRKFFFEELDAEVAGAVEEALRVVTTLTASTSEISLSINTDRTLQAAESYAYHKPYVDKSPKLYDPETLRRIRTGEGIEEAQREQAFRELEQMRREIVKAFGDVEVVITPTTPIPAPNLKELQANPDLLRPRELLLLRNTRPINVWGLPAISVPCGFTQAGLPIGLQIIGPPWEEGRILRLAYAYEQTTAWHKRLPKISARGNRPQYMD